MVSFRTWEEPKMQAVQASANRDHVSGGRTSPKLMHLLHLAIVLKVRSITQHRSYM